MNRFKKLFKQKIRLLHDLDVTEVSFVQGGGLGIGGTVGRTEEKWIDRPWWKEFKSTFPERYFGGIGTLALIYIPLRIVEKYPAIFFICLSVFLGYGIGFLIDRKRK